MKWCFCRTKGSYVFCKTNTYLLGKYFCLILEKDKILSFETRWKYHYILVGKCFYSTLEKAKISSFEIWWKYLDFRNKSEICCCFQSIQHFMILRSVILNIFIIFTNFDLFVYKTILECKLEQWFPRHHSLMQILW